METIGIPRSMENLHKKSDSGLIGYLPLDDFICKNIRWGKEGNFRCRWPPFDEVLVCVKESLLCSVVESVQHIVLINNFY